jgi:hypothetical protein
LAIITRIDFLFRQSPSFNAFSKLQLLCFNLFNILWFGFRQFLPTFQPSTSAFETLIQNFILSNEPDSDFMGLAIESLQSSADVNSDARRAGILLAFVIETSIEQNFEEFLRPENLMSQFFVFLPPEDLQQFSFIKLPHSYLELHQPPFNIESTAQFAPSFIDLNDGVYHKDGLQFLEATKGHLLLFVNCLYAPRLFYNSQGCFTNHLLSSLYKTREGKTQMLFDIIKPLFVDEDAQFDITTKYLSMDLEYGDKTYLDVDSYKP